MLYQAAPGVADPAKFNATMAAIDLAVLRAVGAGVLSGLLVDNSGAVQPGEALIGHVVALAAAAPLNAGSPAPAPALAPASTNFVFLQAPPPPACVGADGRDAGRVLVNQTGILPPNAVLLATVTTGPAPAGGGPPQVTAVSNAPAGRHDLAAPLQGETLVTLAARPLTLTPGVNYSVGADFSAAGLFAGTCYRVACACPDPALVVGESLGPKAPGKLFLTLHYMLAPGGSTAPVTVSVTPSAEGAGWTGQPAAGVAALWDALTSF